MITYELAKQLQDAGFPQECSSPSEIYNDKDRGDGTIENGFFIRNPTFLELLDALGNRFHALEKQSFPDLGINLWVAYSKETNELNIPAHIVVQGYTPESALAKLYIELNKK